MGHVTVDHLDDAWNKLNKAEHLAKNGQTHGAVLECENALDLLYKSANGMGFGVWFSGKEDAPRRDIANLKTNTNPKQENVEKVITDCRDIAKDTKEKVVPELHTRIDYEPEPKF